jgi:hypothetical protein
MVTSPAVETAATITKSASADWKKIGIFFFQPAKVGFVVRDFLSRGRDFLSRGRDFLSRGRDFLSRRCLGF